LEQYFGDDEEIMDCEDIVELQILKQNNGKTPRRCELFDGSTFSMTYKPDDENAGDFDD
jgi:hypothetical protein